MEWCAAFVSWIFVTAYGLAAAIKLLCGGLHCYTPTGAGRFQKAGRYIKRGEGLPKPGDVVFFWSKAKGRIGHVGLVWKVTSTKVYTIEGNTSGASTLVTNGGGVRKKSYALSSTYIDGYGRPDYAAIEAGTGEAVSFDLGDRLLVNGCEGDDVKELQEHLLRLGLDLGKWGVDGEFGDSTELAVREFQKAHDCEPDGEYGPLTHAALLLALSKLDHAEKTGDVRIVNGQCWIRSEPDTSSLANCLGVAKPGDVYPYGGATSEAGWPAIVYGSKRAWVSGKYAERV